MKFKIDSAEISFNGQHIKKFIGLINEICVKHDFDYFIVGAFARDIILENIFKEDGGIATQDIDIAIGLRSWDQYNIFIKELMDNHGFHKGSKIHEFISPEKVKTDIIPYGELEDNRTIIFPGHNAEINMLGFQELVDSSLTISLDGEVEMKIVSVESMLILKLIAWHDRQPGPMAEKHVIDISLIISTYYNARMDKLRADEFASDFSDLLDIEPFDVGFIGARSLGRQIKRLTRNHQELASQLEAIFNFILVDVENSLFVRYYSTATKRDYNYSYSIVENLKRGYEEENLDSIIYS